MGVGGQRGEDSGVVICGKCGSSLSGPLTKYLTKSTTTTKQKQTNKQKVGGGGGGRGGESY